MNARFHRSIDRRQAATPCRNGNVLLVSIVLIPALCAVISLGVDFGRVQVVRSELQHAADAAVRYAVTGIESGPSAVRSRAKSAALANSVGGSGLTLLDSDIELGTWDAASRTFTVLSGAAESNANAVRINARRTSARGTAVPLTFAAMIGKHTCDVQFSVVARIETSEATGHGIAGLEKFELENNAIIDSYDSSNGPWSAGTATSLAGAQSNSDFAMKNNARINGNANPGQGHSVQLNNHAQVTGNTSPLTSPLSFDDVDTSAAASSNNNGSIPAAYFNSGSRKFELENNEIYTMPAGVYYLDEIKLKNNSKLDFTGEVTLYVTDKIEIENNALVTAYSSRPGNLKIRVAGSTDIKLKNNIKLQADLYAPESKIEIENNAEFSGIMVGREILLKNNAKIHQDLSLSEGAGSGGSSTGAITLVD